MKLLQDKRALVSGVANEWSIAWAIAKALHGAGARVAFTCIEKNLRRVRRLARTLDAETVIPCDARDDAQLDAVFAALDHEWSALDVLVHAMAFARTEDLQGSFVNTTREGFHTALDASSYTLIAMSQRARPLMRARGGSIITLTFHGGERVVPGYNVMGVAKAALNMAVRYLAYDLGPDQIRVNAISAGPMKTLSSAAVGGIDEALVAASAHSPLRRAAIQDDVGDAAVFLASDHARAVTGEVLHVDAGLSILGAVRPGAHAAVMEDAGQRLVLAVAKRTGP